MYASMTQWVSAPRSAPKNTTLFAVGDVHGHADELEAMQGLINDLIMHHDKEHALVVYLGDYIDRGPEIDRTLELLAFEAVHETGVERVYLAGNHDQFLIELLKCNEDLDRPFITAWYDNGGESTMRDIGVEGYGRLALAGDWKELSLRTRRALGKRKVEFLERLVYMHRAGDYVFVHAGIDPDIDLDSQDFTDLLLIREPFLNAGPSWRHSFCVVHGHSISMPIVDSHRIGVDAGCYVYGALCSVQIENERMRFVGVSKKADFSWQIRLGQGGYWNWSKPTFLG